MCIDFSTATIMRHCPSQDNGDYITLQIEYRHWLARILRALMFRPALASLPLDALGSATWRLIDGERNCHQIAAQLAVDTEGDMNDLQTRVILFIQKLHQKKLVVLSSGGNNGT